MGMKRINKDHANMLLGFLLSIIIRPIIKSDTMKPAIENKLANKKAINT